MKVTPCEAAHAFLICFNNAAWLKGFVGGWLAPLSVDERAAVLTRAEDLARPRLWTGQQWVADYVRLRALAVRDGV